MLENILEINPKKFSLTVAIKSELEKRCLLEILPHNLSCTYTGLTKLIAHKDENGQTSYRSKERFKITELEYDKVRIDCEECSYFLSACAFLNDLDYEYSIDSEDNYLIKECTNANCENIEELLEDIDCEPRYIDDELMSALNNLNKPNLTHISIG